MKVLLRNWDIGNLAAIEPISSYGGKASLVRTVDGRDFIMKEKSNLLKAERESNLLLRLAKAGAPVAVPVPTMDGTWCAMEMGRVFCLVPRLPGEAIPEHYGGDALGRAEAFGKAIGFLHTFLLKCGHRSDCQELRLLRQIREWVIPCIRGHKASVEAESIENLWRKVEQELKPYYYHLPKQLIHRDAHPGNMLFEAGRLTGFIDCELVVRGPRLFDLCYCGTSLLVSGYPQAEKMQAWPGLFHALVKGYQGVIPLTATEIKAMFGILEAIELLFIAFSLKTGADAAAKSNESLFHWLAANRERITL
jgi:Ser/Thr protein kinase RdoA (MazF antagonist)